MIPDFNSAGDLPPGVYKATLNEVIVRFGASQGQRALITRRLAHLYELAQRIGHLQRLIVFGSYTPTGHYVTDKPDPNDVDVILVMDDAFRLPAKAHRSCRERRRHAGARRQVHVEECPTEFRGLFDHAIAQARYGASIFWIRPGLLIGESLESFIAHWQLKRDGTRRGIVEVEV